MVESIVITHVIQQTSACLFEWVNKVEISLINVSSKYYHHFHVEMTRCAQCDVSIKQGSFILTPGYIHSPQRHSLLPQSCGSSFNRGEKFSLFHSAGLLFIVFFLYLTRKVS